MVSKKGFIRTLEAVIAIILILIFILYITPRVPAIVGKVPENVEVAQTFILNEILFKTNLRNCIINSPFDVECSAAECWADEIQPLIETNKPYGYEYACEISDSSTQWIPLSTLYPSSEGKSIYTHTIFIYKDGIKVVRLYFWRSD